MHSFPIIPQHVFRHPSPPQLQCGLFVFPPKGNNAEDNVEVIREPKETRPMTLKNNDNETLASVVNHSISSVISQGACSVQRGLTQGRNFVQNFVELDVAGRVASNDFFGDIEGAGENFVEAEFDEKAISRIDRMPKYIFLDIAVAFPSLAHKCFFYSVARFLPPPPLWFPNFAKFLYTVNFVVNYLGHFKFWILAGILQGCGLSGSLFALAFDPFLVVLEESIDSRKVGQTRTCADDVGSVSKALGHLKRIAIVFGWASECASLNLNLSKTILIPLGATCNASLIKAIRDWLELHLPSWAQIIIQAKAKYLGFLLGPEAGLFSWKNAFCKHKQRVNSIASSSRGASISLQSYDSQAVPVLSHICQLLPPSAEMLELELHAFLKMLRMPYA